MKVLLFESNEPMREFLPSLASELDFTVVATVEEADAALASGTFDGVITNSAAFTDSVSLPTLFISYGQSGIRKKAKVYLQKPFANQQFLDAISRCLSPSFQP